MYCACKKAFSAALRPALRVHTAASAILNACAHGGMFVMSVRHRSKHTSPPPISEGRTGLGEAEARRREFTNIFSPLPCVPVASAPSPVPVRDRPRRGRVVPRGRFLSTGPHAPSAARRLPSGSGSVWLRVIHGVTRPPDATADGSTQATRARARRSGR